MFGASTRIGLRPMLSSQKPLHTLLPDGGSRVTRLAPSQRSITSHALTRAPGLASRPTISSPSSSILRQFSKPQNLPPSFFTPSLCRHASTAAPPFPSIPSSSNASPSPSSKLDWNTFFKLRTSRRRYSLTFSFITALGFSAGAFYVILAHPSVSDSISQTIPIDPVYSLALVVLSMLLIGWLVGPFFGNSFWNTLHRNAVREFESKERAFFARIKAHRVDPRGGGANNPVPDYYGEKVGSVQGYRRWLKDQRAFNRKKSRD